MFLLGAALVLVTAASAAAHDFWVEPSAFEPRPGETVSLGLWSGDSFRGDPVPRSAGRMTRFAILAPSGESPAESPAESPVGGVDGVHPAGFFTPPAPGAYWVVYETRPRRLTLPADRFESYLREEGLERIIDLRRERAQGEAPGRESYRRCAKSLVEVGRPAAVDGGTAGCPLELVLETSPRAAAAEGAVALRLLFEGRPLAGARVAALRRGTPEPALVSRTDADGRVRFPLAGEEDVWLVKAVHMEPAPVAAGDLDWQSWWASLTLRLPAGAAPPAP